MKYKKDLEHHLTTELRIDSLDPSAYVVVSEDGETAVWHEYSKQTTTRKLSHYAREFMRTGKLVWLAKGQFYEPEKKEK
jgi:hypothetical protein